MLQVSSSIQSKLWLCMHYASLWLFALIIFCTPWDFLTALMFLTGCESYFDSLHPQCHSFYWWNPGALSTLCSTELLSAEQQSDGGHSVVSDSSTVKLQPFSCKYVWIWFCLKLNTARFNFNNPSCLKCFNGLVKQLYKHCGISQHVCQCNISAINQCLIIISAFGPPAVIFVELVSPKLTHRALDKFSPLIPCSDRVLQQDKCSIGHISSQPPPHAQSSPFLLSLLYTSVSPASLSWVFWSHCISLQLVLFVLALDVEAESF